MFIMKKIIVLFAKIVKTIFKYRKQYFLEFYLQKL